MKLAELRKLPVRKWDDVKLYRSIAVINSRYKHESGWAQMYVIGLNGNDEPIEIAACPDDISWHVPRGRHIQTDMFYPSGVIHFWAQGCDFEVGCSSSSVDITLKIRK